MTEPRPKAFRYKEPVVVEREFKNNKLLGEDLAELDYKPLKCGRKYRLIILRKNISVQKGEKVLFDEVLSYNSWLKDFFATWERLEAFSTG